MTTATLYDEEFDARYLAQPDVDTDTEEASLEAICEAWMQQNEGEKTAEALVGR